MTDAFLALPEKIKSFAFGLPVTDAVFSGERFAVACGDGTLRLVGDAGQESHALHGGAVLAVAADPKSGTVFSGGDDGKLFALDVNGNAALVHEGRKWVDAVAASPRGHVAWSCGKQIFLKRGADDAAVIDAPSSVSGLAFAPEAKWLGAAVYGGALLVSPSNPATTKMLEWKGSHTTVGFSRDGRFCVTSMLENALHVWRIDQPDRHGRMGGYPARPLSFEWMADGRTMVTAGADCLVMWPFVGADGPIGQPAEVFEGIPGIVRSVATRPQSRQIAIGYASGAVALFDRKDQRFVILAEPDGSPVIAVRFAENGRRFGFLRENGSGGTGDLGKP